MKYRQFYNHTMCLPKSPNARSIELSQETKDYIVDFHNQERAMTRPPAANMLKMYWDDEIALMAQRWADACEYRDGLTHDKQRHIPGSFYLGQNNAAFTINFKVAFRHFSDEKFEYKYGVDYHHQMKNGRCGFMVGHYTQMVWAKSYKIGCAATNCGNESRTAIVCNYGPSGNEIPFSQPYIAGEQCGMCPNHCNNGLCDCGDMNCHMGVLDPTTCKCNCTFEADNEIPDFVNPDDCSLNCTGRDCHYCGDEVFNDCKDHWTVRKCPHMCRLCPFAEKNYDPSKVYYRA